MPAEFSHAEQRKAAKDYRCTSCSGPILKGTQHNVHSGRDELLGLTRYRRHLPGECVNAGPTSADAASTVMLRVTDPAALGAAVVAGPGSYRTTAKAAGMSHSFIAHLCTGRRSLIALPMAQRLAAAVDRPVSDLFTLDEADALRGEGLV